MAISNGMTALITNSGREPARSLALALAARGWHLALNDMVPLRLEETAEQVRQLGAACSTHIGDVSKGLFARGLVEEALDELGQIDLLVNLPLAEPRLALLDLDEWDFQHTLESNIHGPFLLMQLVGNWMRNEKRRGWIINLISGPSAAPAQAGHEAFYVSQMGLRALTAAAAPELLAYQIQIYGICRGESLPAVCASHVLSLLDADPPQPSGTIFQL
jgi:NAD(P)-dependent dehydrogenase (short-subunit alcohol dehydrogenase family)